MSSKRLHILVTGLVQGVFFRAHTQETAEKFGITGWAKNTSGGDVEIVAEGSEEMLKHFTDWCHRGPPSARVDSVQTEESKATGEFDSFRIKYF